jgi:hypothetical protein
MAKDKTKHQPNRDEVIDWRDKQWDKRNDKGSRNSAVVNCLSVGNNITKRLCPYNPPMSEQIQPIAR